MVDRWIGALEARHLRDFTFSEVVRALRALSARYVERRRTIDAALDTKGKRAAFALFYGPLHFLLVRAIVRSLDATRVEQIVDLGCGTGASGAAWALATTMPASVSGIDRHPWSVEEAAWTYRTLALRGRARRGDIGDARPAPKAAVLAAFAINELSAGDRTRALERMTRWAVSGHPILIVEPIARAVTPWWDEWSASFTRLGGRADEWRFDADLPELVAKLDEAAGLNHRTLTGKSLYVDLR